MSLSNKKKYNVFCSANQPRERYSYSHNMNFNLMRKENTHDIITTGLVCPYFDKLEEHLIGYIEKASYIIGCVAWLTNNNIINALEDKKGIKIIINKEEYISSKMESGQKFYYKCLRGKYNDLPDLFHLNCNCCQNQMIQCSKFMDLFGQVSIDENNQNGAILTCGIVNNLSKMHHKFLVFFDENMHPVGVWTGSYNLSKTSNFSLENALYISDQKVIMEYIKEFMAIFPYSESYNWNSGSLCTSISC